MFKFFTMLSTILVCLFAVSVSYLTAAPTHFTDVPLKSGLSCAYVGKVSFGKDSAVVSKDEVGVFVSDA